MFRLYALYVCSLVLETSALQLQMDGNMEKECEEVDVAITVVGMSGHGKSTLLGALYDLYSEGLSTGKEFPTWASSDPCTKDFSGKVIEVSGGKKVALVDTPCWIDKDKKESDSGVASVWWANPSEVRNDPSTVRPKNPLSSPEVKIAATKNVLVWVLKTDRGSDTLIRETHEDKTSRRLPFLEDLMKLTKPGSNEPQWDRIIWVINGTENWLGQKWKDLKRKGKLDEEKDKIRGEYETLADTFFNKAPEKEKEYFEKKFVDEACDEVYSRRIAIDIGEFQDISEDVNEAVKELIGSSLTESS